MAAAPAAKRLLKRLAVSFPRLTNAIWKPYYVSFLYDEAHSLAAVTAPNCADGRSTQAIFEDIFQKNDWTNSESVSGYGSTLYNTTIIRNELPRFIRRFGIKTLLDAPCGDFNWMSQVEFPSEVDVLACDVVAPLIDLLKQRHSRPQLTFRVLDIVADTIPAVDLWMCRDVLFHLTLDDGIKVLHQAARSGTRYFASTTYTYVDVNRDIPTGRFRFINLQKPPYDLPEPVAAFDDYLAPNAPRILGFWSAAQLQRRFDPSTAR